MHVNSKPFASFTVNRWLGLEEAAAGANLRDCVGGAASGVFMPGKVGAGVEALVCTAANATKTASDRSAVCLFMGTCNFPERGFSWRLNWR
jgi:hypothetical protein